ncbi:MAG: glycerol-3-phosphate dehydrogenase subunit GlpB [Actinobacteria bacterium]|nr:glycerol-3-phosphate dehydrogenase subunit GlpB [Actinomycetota bacterium]
MSTAANTPASRVIVIGTGLAGLVAANRLASGGADVTLLTKGIGGLQLGQGTIDVLGYAPDRVTNPLLSLMALASARAEHPYATIGAAPVHTGLDYLKRLLPDLLVGDPEANYQLPTAVGAIRPTCLAQPSMVAGHLSDGAKVAIVGLRRLKDFYPRLVAENLSRTTLPDGGRVSARPFSVDVPARDGEVDSTGLTYARAFDDPGFRSRFVAAVKPLLEPDEIVGLPAVLGIKDTSAWRDLAEKLGHPVFEIPLPPPSVPGMRLNEALTEKARAAGVRIVNGSRAISARVEDGVVRGITMATAGAPHEYTADEFVLATGGFESGALTLDSYGNVTETLFGLPLAGLDDGPLLHGDYWGSEQPLFKVGVRVGPDMRVVDAAGAVVHPNLYAAGGIIGGSSRWGEKSGDGIALGSAIQAADSILALTPSAPGPVGGSTPEEIS